MLHLPVKTSLALTTDDLIVNEEIVLFLFFRFFTCTVYLSQPLSSLHCLSYTWSINHFSFYSF